jgi:serine acetyltransferase
MTDQPIIMPERTNFLTRLKKFGLLPALRTTLRDALLAARRYYLVNIWGMDIHPLTLISLKANLDKTNPRGIHIGEGTNISFGAVVLSHDMLRKMHLDTRIGRYCAIGAHSIILPGITIGDHSIVGAGTVVTKDVPPHSIVVGNPSRIIRSGIQTTLWGILVEDTKNAASGTAPELTQAHRL